MKIQFTVTNQHIDAKVPAKVVADSKNYLEAAFYFVTPEWEGLPKTAVFKNSYATYNVILDGCSCLVPPECIIAGEMEVSLYGGDRITTDVAKVKIFPSGYRPGETPPPPTPDVYSEILNRLQTIQAGTVSEADIRSAVETYLTENPVVTVSEDDVKRIAKDVFLELKESETETDVEEDIAPQSAEYSVSDLDEFLSEQVEKYFEAHRGEFVGPAGASGADGKDGVDGVDSVYRVVDKTEKAEAETSVKPGEVVLLGDHAVTTVVFEKPEDESVENVYTVKFTADSSGTCPLFMVRDGKGYIEPRTYGAFVEGDSYKAVFEWSDQTLRIL